MHCLSGFKQLGAHTCRTVLVQRAESSMVQFWMSPHPPKRGISMLATCPKVHTGFHKAWTARGLHTQVIQYLQVQLH